MTTSHSPRRSIADNEISLIKAMLKKNFDVAKIQAYFTHPERIVHHSQISEIEQGRNGSGIAPADDNLLSLFINNWDATKNTVYTIQNTIRQDDTSPTSRRRILALFQTTDTETTLIAQESEEIECKQSFHSPNQDDLLRSVAAFANNRGGYILFGIENATRKLTGLQSDRFLRTDASRFSQSFQDAMHPCPRFRVDSVDITGKSLGIIYVFEETDGPIIATKTVPEKYRAGMIYFRYPGESKAILATDFRRLLSKRDRRVTQEAAAMSQRAIELGDDGAILDLSTGTLEGKNRTLTLSPDLLDKIKFINEGNFSEKYGAPTLRLIGDVERPKQDAPNQDNPTRDFIRDDAVLLNFLNGKKVPNPRDHYVYSCHSRKSWLPLFYFIAMSGDTISKAIEIVNKETGCQPRARRALIERIMGQRSAGKAISATYSELLEDIAEKPAKTPQSRKEIRREAVALQRWPTNEQPIEIALSRIKSLYEVASKLPQTRENEVFLTEIRKAASWIDQLYFQDRCS